MLKISYRNKQEGLYNHDWVKELNNQILIWYLIVLDIVFSSLFTNLKKPTNKLLHRCLIPKKLFYSYQLCQAIFFNKGQRGNFYVTVYTDTFWILFQVERFFCFLFILWPFYNRLINMIGNNTKFPLIWWF